MRGAPRSCGSRSPCSSPSACSAASWCYFRTGVTTTRPCHHCRAARNPALAEGAAAEARESDGRAQSGRAARRALSWHALPTASRRAPSARCTQTWQAPPTASSRAPSARRTSVRLSRRAMTGGGGSSGTIGCRRPTRAAPRPPNPRRSCGSRLTRDPEKKVISRLNLRGRPPHGAHLRLKI